MSELINLDTLFAATQTGAGANVLLREELAAHRQFPGAWPAVTTAIVRDTLTPTRAYTIVETEGGTATDILGLINPVNTHDGIEVKLISQDSRAITVRHQPTVANGITLAGGADITLSTSRFLLLKRFGDRWREIVDGSAVNAIPSPLTVVMGGTGATTAGAARTNLGAVNKAGDTMTGSLVLKGANTVNQASISASGSVNAGTEVYIYKPNLAEDSHYANISFRTTNKNGTTSNKFIHLQSISEDETQGDNAFIISGRGMLFAGSGESATAIREVLVTGNTALPEGLSRYWTAAGSNFDGSEHTIISSDNNIHFITGCNTIANARGAYLNTSGYFSPHQEGQLLGGNNARWDAYIRNLNVSGTVTGITGVSGSEIITTSKTWTAPHTGVFHFLVIAGGGGGGGRYYATASQFGGTGGTGGAAVASLILTEGAIINITIGAGGSGGASGAANSYYGGSGGSSSIQSTISNLRISASGGNGGTSSNSTHIGDHGSLYQLNNRPNIYGTGGTGATVVSAVGGKGGNGAVEIIW